LSFSETPGAVLMSLVSRLRLEETLGMPVDMVAANVFLDAASMGRGDARRVVAQVRERRDCICGVCYRRWNTRREHCIRLLLLTMLRQCANALCVCPRVMTLSVRVHAKRSRSLSLGPREHRILGLRSQKRRFM
jgi:hypothetical protein